jgi:hypothetical protein
MVDNKRIFQWPLGVATYRGFPANLPVNTGARRYLCNFMGTVRVGLCGWRVDWDNVWPLSPQVYPESSREVLVELLHDNPQMEELCFVKTRDEWVGRETPESAEEYRQVLLNSYFTLCPAGLNTE